MINFWENLVSGVLVRLLCFAAVALTLPVMTLLLISLTRGHYGGSAEATAAPYLITVMSPFPYSPYWIAVLAASAGAAIELPRRRRKLQERKSARLQAVVEASKMPPDAGANS